jgi:ABC-type Fe3+/spermidine/putrescine transport system ATPase subunit
MKHLQIRSLRKRFGPIEAVRGVSLDVAKGELVCLLGPSGCGKTTLLNMVAGFLAPDEGEIILRGKPVQHLPPRRRNMGMVFQSYALFPHLPVEENVAFGLEARGIARAERLARARTMLDLVGLSGMAERLPRALSGGQQQRVALARALLIEPDVLLLDEPFSNLDARLRQTLRDEVRAIQTRIGISTLFVTHDQEEAMAMSDRVAVVNEGRIEQVDTPSALYHRPRTPFVATFLGEANVLQGEAENAGVVVAGVMLPLAGRVAGTVGFCVRPEAVRIAPAEAMADALLAGTITAFSFLGARMRYEVRTQVGQIGAHAPGTGTPLAVGARVGLAWNAADAWVFGADA